MISERASALAALAHSEALEEDFRALVATGGRLVGSASEAAAYEVLRDRLRGIPAARRSEHRFHYSAWESRGAELRLADSAATLRCHPLYWSAPTPPDGLETEVIDVGRGTEEDFRAKAKSIRKGIVLAHHEYPFASGTIHRRVKYNRARELGAAGFLIANNLPGELLVTGSCGQDSPENIPGMGVSLETGQRLSTPGTRVRMVHSNGRRDTAGVNLIAEVAGREPEWIVVCAHYDGHDLAESALDNATGIASTLAILRAFAPYVPRLRRGLRVILFTAEESGLLGSRRYVESLTRDQRRAIAAVINLDTTVGSERMGCLTSGFPQLEQFARATGALAGMEFGFVEGLLRNSDHFNFAEHGIPALRLVAGFDDPCAGARYILTEADQRDKVSLDDLRRGALFAGGLVWNALDYDGTIASHGAGLSA